MKSLIKANEKKIPTLCTQGQTIPSFYRNTLKKCVCLSPLWNFIPTFSQTNKNLVLVALFWRFNIFFKNCKVWDLEQKPFVLQFIYINSVSLTEMSDMHQIHLANRRHRRRHCIFYLSLCLYLCMHQMILLDVFIRKKDSFCSSLTLTSAGTNPENLMYSLKGHTF